jgi:hypothetical protein
MSKISRRELLRTSAGAGAIAGLALTTGPGVASAGTGTHGVHIHTVFVDGGGPGDDIRIDVTALGTPESLSGAGWDFESAPAGGQPPSFSACYFAQYGSVRRNRIRLTGKVLFANDASSLDVVVTTGANLATGEITWTFGTFVFEGTGTVIAF